MVKHRPVNYGIISVFFFAALSSFLCGCARYAPVPPPPPKDKILTITLYTRSNITSDFYYYIAFDLSNSPDSDGPLPYLSGDDIGENWNYYLRLKDGIFTEEAIASESDLYDEPSLFDTTSPRFYSQSLYGNRIILRMYLDQLRTGTFDIRLNFVTSRAPFTDTNIPVDVVDYLDKPCFTIRNVKGQRAYASQYPHISNTVSSEADFPADIINWLVEVDEI